MKALFDTNILIDYLNGVELAKHELAKYEILLISRISWMEVMVGVPQELESAVLDFLSNFQLVEISMAVCETAVEIRKSSRIKLPDAIIQASAKETSAILVTRNTKDFSVHEPFVREPYKL